MKGVTTTEKMMIKKMSRMPPLQMRNKATDLVDEEESKQEEDT